MIKINGSIYNPKETFPNGERIYPIPRFKPDAKNPITVDWLFDGNIEELIHLVVLDDYLLKTLGKRYILVIRYLPFSRMDRETDTQLFSLLGIANIISTLHYNVCHVFEPHNPEVLRSHIDYLGEHYAWENLEFNMTYVALGKDKTLYKIFTAIFLPDAGSAKRYPGLVEECIRYGIPVYYGAKKRSPADGSLQGFRFADGVIPNLRGDNVLIVDDLCSRGGTFLGQARILKDAGAEVIGLLLGHGEDAMDNAKLAEDKLIDMIFIDGRGLRPNILWNWDIKDKIVYLHEQRDGVF